MRMLNRRSLINTNTIFFLIVLAILTISLYNVLHFSARLLENQCDKALKAKTLEIDRLNAQLVEIETNNQPPVHHPVSSGSWSDNNSAIAPPPPRSERLSNDDPVIPILVIACNREDYLEVTLNFLLKHRPSKRFPIVVSQGCDHEPVERLLREKYENKAIALKHHRQPRALPYFAIAQHYGWALAKIFTVMDYDAVIVVEDDLEISPDFYNYFAALYPILRDDPSLYCVSSWNDNGMTENVKDPKGIYRTDVFPGLGWMMTKNLWNEIESKWPDRYWDEFMREPRIRRNRQCLYPEISRNRNIGERGTSDRQFWDKISRIKFNEEFVNFTDIDMSYLLKEEYDKNLLAQVKSAQKVTFSDVSHYNNADLRITYDSIPQFVDYARMFKIMDDEKEGMPRTSYKGIVTFYDGTNRIFLTPEKII